MLKRIISQTFRLQLKPARHFQTFAFQREKNKPKGFEEFFKKKKEEPQEEPPKDQSPKNDRQREKRDDKRGKGDEKQKSIQK